MKCKKATNETRRPNQIIRDKLSQYGVCQYELAECVGVSEFTFSRMMRKEFSESDTESILSMIANIHDSKQEDKD